MHTSVVHKQEQQMNSEPTVLHWALVAKERPEKVFYNIDLYVIIIRISVDYIYIKFLLVNIQNA